MRDFRFINSLILSVVLIIFGTINIAKADANDHQTKQIKTDFSLASFNVRQGFKIEMVASEPMLCSPVAFEWGADGKLWVVEMRDYPQGIQTSSLQLSPPSAGREREES